MNKSMTWAELLVKLREHRGQVRADVGQHYVEVDREATLRLWDAAVAYYDDWDRPSGLRVAERLGTLYLREVR